MTEKLSDKARGIHRFINQMKNKVGCNVHGRILHWRVVVIICIGIIEQIMHIHGLIKYSSDVVVLINGIQIYSILLQTVYKFIVLIFYPCAQITNELADRINKFYERNEADLELKALLTPRIIHSEIAVKIYTGSTYAGCLTPLLTSMVVSYFTGSLRLIAPIYLPFTDPFHSTFGYILNTSIMLLVAVTAGTLLIITDVILLYFGLHSIAIADVYVVKMQRLTKRLHIYEEEATILTKNESEALKALIESYFEYESFIKLLQKIFKLTTFIAIVCNSVAIGMASFVAMNYSLPIGISFLIVFIMEVAVPCVIGEIIKHQNERILREFCYIPWYKLSKANRKDYLQLLMMCQTLPALEIPLIGHLSFELLMNIVYGGYSYLMIILNFTKYRY